MNINNNFLMNSFNYDIKPKNINQIKMPEIGNQSLVDVIAAEIKIENATVSKLILSGAQIDEKINNLDEIKNTLDSKTFDFDEYLSHIPISTKKEEESRASEFLNPNQKFSSQTQKNEYLSKLESSNINILLLSKTDRETYFENFEKAISDTFEKENDFDSVINDVYTIKKSLENSTSITNNTSNKDEISLLEDVKEKLLLASDNATSLEDKKNLVTEIKDLLKDLKNDASSDLSQKLDDIVTSQELELEELTSPSLDINSFSDAKVYLEKLEKHDASFNDLSTEDKKNYLENKKMILEMFSSKEDLPSSNDELTSILKDVIKNESKKVSELTSIDTSLLSLDDAKEFLENAQKRQTSVNTMSETHKDTLRSNKQLAEQIIKDDENKNLENEKKIFVENIDNLINILNDLKYSGEVFEDSIDFKKESLSFSSESIIQKNGDFLASQSLYINKNELQKLIS